MKTQGPKIRFVESGADSVSAHSALRYAFPRALPQARIVSEKQPHLPRPAQVENQALTPELETASPAAAAPNTFFPSGLLALALLLFGIGSYFLFFARVPEPAEEQVLQPSKTYSAEELKIAWYSMRPSVAAQVARLALDLEQPNRTAELLIVNSALKGEEVVAGVDARLIAAAFDPRWEIDLKPADRRLVLALGVGKLLGDTAVSELPQLAEVHPGVLLALTGSAGENMAKMLADQPVSRLAGLPAPYGSAFAKLDQTEPGLNCGSEIIRTFAQLKVRGGVSPQQLLALLAEHSAERLEALAWLLSEDEARAAEVLNVLLLHPNMRLPDDRVRWAEAVGLHAWKELSAREKLQLLAGLVRGLKLNTEHVLVLLAHPSPAVRGAGAELALNTVRFAHPAAYNTLLLLSKQPEQLSAEGTALLAEVLKKSAAESEAEISAFVQTQPPATIVSELLLAESAAAKSDLTPRVSDFRLARYLAQSGRLKELRSSQLGRMALHSHPYVRLLSYQRIFELEDPVLAVQLLQAAYEREKNPQHLAQLEAMLEALKAR